MDKLDSIIEKIEGVGFAYDGCHKIYVCEDKEDIKDAKETGYTIYDMSELKEKFEESCGLRFISNWKLDKTFIAQFELDECNDCEDEEDFEDEDYYEEDYEEEN